MMCACDQFIGETYLSHQIDSGREFETNEEHQVTLGFVSGICSECRGLPADNFPKAELYGNSSKIKRYYWRELHFRKYEKVVEKFGVDTDLYNIPAAERKIIENDVLDEIKAQHKNSPKYKFTDLSQSEVIKKYEVECIDLRGEHIRASGQRRVKINHDEGPCSPEQFAARHFKVNGYQALEMESVPFHVLFGVFMWLLVQDNADSKVRIVGFGSRNGSDNIKTQNQIWTSLPEDFGKPGYGKRRKRAIDKHFERDVIDDKEQLSWLFDYWLPYSHDFREYLWAHREEDVEVARRLIEILPASMIQKILTYLVENYWGRYLGWPDLVVWNDEELFFVEVKSSRDKLNGDQKNWIADNFNILKIPFKLVKIHKPNQQG